MKKKELILFILTIVGIFTYIQISALIINENNYKELSYRIIKPTDFDKQTSREVVSLIKLNNTSKVVTSTVSQKINRFLLFLNGGRAIQVSFYFIDSKTPFTQVYYNPFTKQYIGYK